MKLEEGDGLAKKGVASLSSTIKPPQTTQILSSCSGVHSVKYNSLDH